MTKNAPITYAEGWRRFEAKNIGITVLDDAGTAVNCSALTLEWRLLRQAGDAASRAYIDKTKADGEITVSGASSNVCTVAIAVADYDNVPAGYYWHELWDRGNDMKLAEGIAVLGEGSAA